MRAALLCGCLTAVPALACLNSMAEQRRHEQALNGEAGARQALWLLTEGQHEKALQRANEVAATKWKLSVRARSMLVRVRGIANVRLARHTEARKWLTQAIAAYGDDPLVISALAEAEVAAHAMQQARDRLEPLAERDLLPNAEAHLALARARHATGDAAGARAEVEATLRQDPSSIGAKALRGVLDVERGATKHPVVDRG